MITHDIGFTRDFSKKRCSYSYTRLRQIPCGIKRQVRACAIHAISGLASWNVCAAISPGSRLRMNVWHTIRIGRTCPRSREGGAVLKLKTPYRDGTIHIVMPLLEFKQRLAAGWYAGQGSTSSSSVSMACLRRMRKLCAEIIPGSKKNKSNASNANDPAPHSSASVRISWARLHKRVFEIDIEHTARIVAGI